MKRWWQVIRRWLAAYGSVIMGLLMLLCSCVGVPLIFVWAECVYFPSMNAERREAFRKKQQEARETNLWRAGSTWLAVPGNTDPLGLDALDPKLIPEAERYPWQPKGLVAVLGSHSGRHWPYYPDQRLGSVCWSPGGDRIYTGGQDGWVRVWEADGLRAVASLKGPHRLLLALAVSSDGRWLAACGGYDLGDGWVRVWKILPHGFEEYTTFAWPDSYVASVAFSSDSRRLVAGGGKSRKSTTDRYTRDIHGWVRLWDIEGDDIDECYTLASPREATWALAFSPDSKLLAASSDDGAIRLWNLAAANMTRFAWWKYGLLATGCGFIVIFFLTRYFMPLSPTCVFRAPAEKRIATWPPGSRLPSRWLGLARAMLLAMSPILLIWGTALWWFGPGFARPISACQHDEGFCAVAWSPKGETLASGHGNGAIKLWRVAESGLELVSSTEDGESVYGLTFSPDGRTLAASRWRSGKKAPPEEASAVRVYSVTQDGLTLPKDLLDSKAVARGLAFAPDGKLLAVACAEGKCEAGSADLRSRLRIWDLSRPVPAEQTPDREGLHVQLPLLAPATSFLLTADADRRSLWKVSGGRLVRHAHIDLDRWYSDIVWLGLHPKETIYLDVVSHEERDRREGDRGVPFPSDKESAEDAVKRGYPVTLSLLRLSGQVLEAVHTDRYLFESGGDYWSPGRIRNNFKSTFAIDGRGAAWCFDAQRVHVWDLRAKEYRKHGELAVKEGVVRALDLSPQLRWAAVVTSKKKLQLWNLTGKEPRLEHSFNVDTEWGEVRFLGDSSTLVFGANEKITLWNLSGPKPQTVFSDEALEELTPEWRDQLALGVRKHPRGYNLPDNWRAAFLPWTHKLHATVGESSVVVTREDRQGTKTKLLEWSPPGEIRWTQFSGDGRHLIVTNGNGTIEVIRLAW